MLDRERGWAGVSGDDRVLAPHIPAMSPALWAALLHRELCSRACHVTCGSGRAREEPNTVHGTVCWPACSYIGA